MVDSGHVTMERTRAPAAEAGGVRFAPDADLGHTKQPAVDGVPKPRNKLYGWSQRNKTWMKNHKFTTVAIFFGMLGANFTYDRYTLHGNLTPSPAVDNDLYYRMEVQQGAYWDRVKAWFQETAVDVLPWLRKTQYPQSKDDLNMDAEVAKATAEKLHQDHSRTRMIVTPQQLSERKNYWDVRSNERNWSLVSRDMQRQQDEYAYRMERSKDNDWERHSSRR
jgi:hypothetical protein